MTGQHWEGTRFRFFIWDRENPDYTYFPGKDGLYRYDVTNPGYFQKVAELPNVDRVKNCYSYPSEDNIVMLIDDFAGVYPSPYIYFIDLNKSMGSPGQVTSYPTALGVIWPGHDQTKEKSFHDIYFTRRSDRSYSFNFGPVGDVGETIFFIAPFDGNPANIALWYDNAGGENAPYHSHPAWGPNGDRTAYFGERYPYGDNHWGLHVADDTAREHVRTLGWYANGLFGGGHIAWDGYDPDFIFCAPGGSTLEKPLFRAWLSKPDNNAEGFVNTYTDNSAYQSIPRPAQSPDATKAFYHSTMLETGKGYADSYIAVARFPFPAANLRMSEGSSVHLSWDPPAFHRETKGYHVYRSIGTLDHFVEITGAAISGTSFTDAQGFPSGNAFYAVTTEEWSGLESRELSNVLEVVRNGSSYSVSGGRGPGLTGFDTSAPAAPANLQATNLEAGVNELSWTPSSDPGLWYYNIYYSVEGTPQAIPERRAASVPRGRSAYIDWQARTDAVGYYLVTAVDRQGNESVVTPTTPPTTFTAWRAANFSGTDLTNDSISGPNADPDGCGLTNFARYAFALSARGPVANPITLGTADTTTGRVLTLTFPRRATATDLTYIVESSTDLANWTAVPDRTYTAGSGPITAQDAVALGTAPRRFLRLRLTATP